MNDMYAVFIVIENDLTGDKRWCHLQTHETELDATEHAADIARTEHDKHGIEPQWLDE